MCLRTLYFTFMHMMPHQGSPIRYSLHMLLHFLRSGLFMGLMASMILPLNLSLATERNFTERGILKTALEIARYGLMLMVNYESIFFFISTIT